MKLVAKFQKCRGFKLFRWGRWQAELWFCPAGEIIPIHWHKYIDSELVFLGGKMHWEMPPRAKDVGWRDIGRHWSVHAGTPHGATVTGLFGLFLNIEQWLEGEPPTSAARDFVRPSARL